MNLALVTPWFGAELRGGAERLAWQTAHGLANRGHHVSVLTTCARSFFSDWSENFYKAGEMSSGKMKVLRFPTDTRAKERFDRVNKTLIEMPQSALRKGVSPIVDSDARTFASESINSTQLRSFLRSHCDEFDAVLLVPYLYGPILNTWREVAHRAFLQPCLHDEPYAYLPEVAAMMRGVKGLLFNSEGEYEVAMRLYGPSVATRGFVVGSAIEYSPSVTSNGHRKSNQHEPYLLYLGRRTDEKNIGFLIDAFRAYRTSFPNATLGLVLAGSGNASYTDEKFRITDEGFVSEERKRQLIDGCRALVQPSKNESYSRTIMEAWISRKPVVVHGACAATSIPVAESGGGWAPSSSAQWAEVFQEVNSSDAVALAELGERGFAYAIMRASWPAVLDNIVAALETTAPTKVSVVNHFVARFEYGDALSLEALGAQRALAGIGVMGKIYAQSIDHRFANLASRPHDFKQEHAQEPLLVYERSDLAALRDLDVSTPKVALLHEQPLPATLLELEPRLQACRDLYAAIPWDPSVKEWWPLTNQRRWEIAPDDTLMSSLQDGCPNIVCVGSIVEGAGHEELLQMFAHYLTMDLNARLIVVGKFDFEDPYYQNLLRIVYGSALAGHVLITGTVSEPALAAIYATATAYCTLAENNQLGFSLVEAMWFDIPVCAFATQASRRILADAGILITEKGDLLRLAALIRLLCVDTDTRRAVLRSQRQRREHFSAKANMTRLREMMEAFSNENIARVP